MYYSFLSYTVRFGQEGGYNIGDVFKKGGTYAIVGYLTVFAVLAIIWGILELFHRISHGGKKKAETNQEPLTSLPQPVPVVEAPSTSTVANDDEIVAVIAAAIAAAQSENPIGSFRVVSFKRK